MLYFYFDFITFAYLIKGNMVRSHTLFIILLLCLSFFTQHGYSENNHSTIYQDSLPIRKKIKNKIIKATRRITDIDTTYISPNRYNYAFMTTYLSNFEYFTIGTSSPTSQSLMFSPSPHNRIGLYFGWRWLFIGYSVDMKDLFYKRQQEKKGVVFNLSLYSSKIGMDIFYRSTGDDYYIYRSHGFSDNIRPEYLSNFSGLQVYMKGLNLYYIFNNRRFSYPAAFSQSTNQRRNAGSLIMGFSVSEHNLTFDYKQLPIVIQQEMNEGMKIQKIKYTNTSLSVGYAYNWVFARNCLACLSVTPALAYKTSNINTQGIKENKRYGNLNLDLLCRAGIVYNNSKYYIGSSFIGENYRYHRDNFSVDNGFGFLQVYAGFNFNLKKEYRKRKK